MAGMVGEEQLLSMADETLQVSLYYQYSVHGTSLDEMAWLMAPSQLAGYSPTQLLI